MMNIKGRGLLLMALLACLSLPFTGDSQEEAEFIPITKAPRKFRVAVPDFRTPPGAASEKAEARQVTVLMREAMELSNLFEVIPEESYTEPVVPTGGKEDFATWQLINTYFLIRGNIARLEGDRYQIEFRCYDVKRKELLVGKRYTGSADLFNRMVYRFVDEIMGYLFSEKGALDARIAYVTDINKRNEIYVMDTDGSHNQRLTKNQTLNLSPAWSRDGRYIMYTGYRARNPDIYIADLKENKEWKFFSREGLNIAGEFSPDGRMIAFSRENSTGNVDIYIISASGQDLRRITSSSAIEVSPTWSPDGKFLAFVSDRTGAPQIYLLDLTRGEESVNNPAVRITTEGGYNSSPAWSPNGRWIAYAGRVGGQFDLFLLDMEAGREPRRLTATTANEEDPAWSPDSRFIAYTSNKHGNYDIFLMSVYGGTPKRITRGPTKDRMPAWSPRIEP